MTTINENCLHHYPYNDQTLMRKSDEELRVTGNHDSLADIDPDVGLHLIQNNQCTYYNITEFNSAITDKNHISILAVNIRSLNKNHDSLADIDPDVGLHLIQNNQCTYYNITEFNSAITDKNHISILAVNIRSLNKNHDSLADIDPDVGLHLIQNNQCTYYNITEFNSAITDKNHISILAVNIRSLNKNFKQFLQYINSLEVKWSFIRITETWGKPHSIIHHTIAGYEHVYDIRPIKTGGGFSLFINENISYKIRKDLTFAESVFIEVEKTQKTLYWESYIVAPNHL